MEINFTLSLKRTYLQIWNSKNAIAIPLTLKDFQAFSLLSLSLNV